MRRRRFVQTLTGIAIGASSSLVGLEALRQGLGYAMGGADEWDQVISEYAHQFYLTPPTELADRLAVDLSVLGRLIDEAPEDTGLQRVAAILSMIMAGTLTNAGQIWPARRWWDTAHAAAQRSGDPAVQVMFGWQAAVRGIYAGRPLQESLDLADEAIARSSGQIYPGTPGALATRAQTLALMGRRDEAIAAVRAAEDVTERIPSSFLTDEGMFGWHEHRLRHTQSFVYTQLRETAAALDAQDRAFAIYPDAQAVNRAMVAMHRAACIIQQGDVPGGLRYAADTLDSLPQHQHGPLVYAMARRALVAVPEQERRRAEVRELHDRLSEPPQPTPATNY